MMLPGNIASTYKLPEPQKQVAKLDVTSLLGCKESLQLLLELLGCIAHNRHSQTYRRTASSAQAALTLAQCHCLQLMFKLIIVGSFCIIVGSFAGYRTVYSLAGLTMVLQEGHFFFVLFGICLSSFSLSLLNCFTFQLPFCYLNQ
jgi:hypothetical protein